MNDIADAIATTEFVAEKMTNRFPDGSLEQGDVLRYGDDPAVEPQGIGIRAIINAGQFPADADTPLQAFHRAHEDAIKELRGDLGLLPPGSWIEFRISAEDGRRLRLGSP